MATSTSRPQDVLTCDLCSTPIQQFCNCCQVCLCESCVKRHRDEFKSLIHEIVPFLDRKIKLAYPACHEHTGQRCELNCTNCNIPVCIRCIGLGPHKGHDVEELTETHENKIRKIKSDTEEIKSKLIPKYQKRYVETENTISKAKSKLELLFKESNKLRKLWHQEVDGIFDKVDSLRLSKEEHLFALEEYKNKIINLLSEMNNTVKRNDKLSTSYKLTEINKYQSKLNEYENFPEDVHLNLVSDFSENEHLKLSSLSSNTNTGKELSLKIDNYLATLKQMSQPSQSADNLF